MDINHDERDRQIEIVFNLVSNFFKDRAGVEQSNSDGSSSSSLKQAPLSRSLLQIAYMGNVEKTIQGELFVYLHNNLPNDENALGLFPVLEFGHFSRDKNRKLSRRAIDIMVFCPNSEPLVAIELKNHSGPNQRGLQSLILGLKNDSQKDYPCWPINSNNKISLIQVGLCTTMESISSDNREIKITEAQDFPIYRFIDSYSHRVRGDEWENYNEIWTQLADQNNIFHLKTDLIHGKEMTVRATDAQGKSYDFRGRINYFIGCRKWGHRCINTAGVS